MDTRNRTLFSAGKEKQFEVKQLQSPGTVPNMNFTFRTVQKQTESSNAPGRDLLRGIRSPARYRPQCHLQCVQSLSFPDSLSLPFGFHLVKAQWASDLGKEKHLRKQFGSPNRSPSELSGSTNPQAGRRESGEIWYCASMRHVLRCSEAEGAVLRPALELNSGDPHGLPVMGRVEEYLKAA